MLVKNINVIYQHDDFYIVSKPNDVNFHDEGDIGSGFFNTVCNELNEKLYPVHRLDKLTSGCLILARNSKSAAWFQTAFADHKITKYYLALIDQKPKKKQGSIIGDMEKSRRGQWRLTKSKLAPAITRFFSFSLENQNQGLRVCLLKPESGKTHQLRVALKSLGAPIMGDKLYGGSDADRGYLHAAKLSFDYHKEQIDAIAIPNTGRLFVEHHRQIHEIVSSVNTINWPK